MTTIDQPEESLSHKDLYKRDFGGLNLEGKDLRHSYLVGANFRGAKLDGANLAGAILWGADFTGASLFATNFHDADWEGLALSELPSGQATFVPPPLEDGEWWTQIGCWSGTLEALEEMISGDIGWPAARGVECDRRRPSLQAWIALCRAHIKARKADR